MPYMVSICGHKSSGKTTLCKRLIEILGGNLGLDVGYIKHCHDSVISPENTDSGTIATSGIKAVLWGTDGIRAEVLKQDFALRDIERSFFPQQDIVLVEGGKSLSLPKIWVGGKSPSADVKGIFAVFNGPENLFPKLPHFQPQEEEKLAEWILQRMGRKREHVVLYVGGQKIGLNDFIMNFIAGTVRGMMSSLKGIEGKNRDIVLVIKEQKG
ncbi:MAG TPA: molybdopterin-guanine dinucleotide biosynthesis protein MobB [Acetomicrobium sp.]|uniref:molybdopterin-guanine dinucleotide biosynthesis protein B n=1 Tax=Acetomicrobium sp. TaxID=1872099 RepID=UPI002B26410D|nr:molybdopterin-guanine dinucleotide biosynthesis protein MobB [Acetomicrobium sp.]HPT64540.1 molybdopterin-guanine dinucleotide biosynthesis protein MobB [Acetomicrobium sp.]HXK98798.1 molybdopterin-guanine dinucleotide biosynthesis protein MobB [Acetomicrobium sp.]